MCAEVTYSALELGAGETQTTCGEDRLTSLLLLHHGEAVPVSPAEMHQVSRLRVCFFNLIKSRASESSVDLSVSRSGNKGGDHHPSFVQKRLEFLHAGVVDRVFGAVVVAVTPKHAGS